MTARRRQQATLLAGPAPARLTPGVEPEDDQAEPDGDQDRTAAWLTCDLTQGLLEPLRLVWVESLCCVEEEAADRGEDGTARGRAHRAEERDDGTGAGSHLVHLQGLF